MLAVLASLAVAVTGQTCAVIDNTTNAAAVARPGHAARLLHYTDMSGIRYQVDGRTLTDDEWSALHRAEKKLLVGKPGHKLRLACR